MTQSRVLLLVRLVLAVLLIRQGANGMSDLQHLARTVELHNSWQAWPLVGSLRPMEVAIWLAGGEFTVGIFLLGGLLTRVSALASALLALFALATLNGLGLAANLAHGALLVASLAALLKGGGAGTMDSELGRMQRKSLERGAQRQAALRQEEARVQSPQYPRA